MTEKNAIETYSAENRTFEPSPEFVAHARISSRAQYDALYKESIESPDSFWKRETSDLVFKKPWSALREWQLPHSKWFVGAELNASESCLDRHLQTLARPDGVTLTYGYDTAGRLQTTTYPLVVPLLPWPAIVGILLALIPAWATAPQTPVLQGNSTMRQISGQSVGPAAVGR